MLDTGRRQFLAGELDAAPDDAAIADRVWNQIADEEGRDAQLEAASTRALASSDRAPDSPRGNRPPGRVRGPNQSRRPGYRRGTDCAATTRANVASSGRRSSSSWLVSIVPLIASVTFSLPTWCSSGADSRCASSASPTTESLLARDRAAPHFLGVLKPPTLLGWVVLGAGLWVLPGPWRAVPERAGVWPCRARRGSAACSSRRAPAAARRRRWSARAAGRVRSSSRSSMRGRRRPAVRARAWGSRCWPSSGCPAGASSGSSSSCR